MDFLALLFPREKKFYVMIEEQVASVGEAVSDFERFISSYNKTSSKQRQKIRTAISKNEQHDDVLYSRMVKSLRSTFITPMDREDIHRLVVTFDAIVDGVELLSLKMEAYDIAKMDPYLIKQAKFLHTAYDHIEKIILSLRRESEVEIRCTAVRKIEQEADIVYMNALKDLFADSLEPVDIIKLQDLYASMEKMIDQLSKAALIIENLSVKYS